MLFITGDLISVSRAALGTRCYRGGNATPNPPGVLRGGDDMGTGHGTLPAKWAAGLPPAPPPRLGDLLRFMGPQEEAYFRTAYFGSGFMA